MQPPARQEGRGRSPARRDGRGYELTRRESDRYEEIRRAEELPRNVARHAPGRTIEVRMLRDGREVTLAAKLETIHLIT